MARRRRTQKKRNRKNEVRHLEEKTLQQSQLDLGRVWIELGRSMGSEALRGVIHGMSATAQALASLPVTNPSEHKMEHTKHLRHWTNVASAWTNVGREMGKVALEKTVKGLEKTATVIEHRKTTPDEADDKSSDKRNELSIDQYDQLIIPPSGEPKG